MSQRRKVGVVADDVTGANDIGIMFVRGGYTASVYTLRGDTVDLPERVRSLDVIILDTDSRFDPPEIAAAKVRAATRLLMQIPCDLYMKKTCSVFRGNIGAEFDAMQDELAVDCSMVVLGFPRNGRQTIEGIHYVHGVRLDQSPFRNDPIHPMHESSLLKILACQSRRPAAGVHADWLDKPLDELAHHIEDLRRQNRYLIFDVRNQDDLRRLSSVLADERCICGSSAIGETLPEAWQVSAAQTRPHCKIDAADTSAAHIPPHFKIDAADTSVSDTPQEPCSSAAAESPAAPGRIIDPTGVLVMAGSLTSQTLAQVDWLRQQGVPAFELDSRRLILEQAAVDEIDRVVGQSVPLLARGQDVLIYAAQSADLVDATRAAGRIQGLTREQTGKRVSAALFHTAEAIIRQTGLRKIVIAGGDTSAAVMDGLGIREMQILHEIEAGVPTMYGYRKNEPYLLVLKSGSFGSPAFLDKAVQRLRELVRDRTSAGMGQQAAQTFADEQPQAAQISSDVQPTEAARISSDAQPTEAADLTEARLLLCQISKLLFDRHLAAGTDGNISMRLDAQTMLITPSGICKGMLKPNQLLVETFDRQIVSGSLKSSKEDKVHIRIYRERPDVGAIVHTHPPASTAFAICGETIPADLAIELPMLIGPVALAPYAQPGTDEVPDSLDSLIAAHDAILLQNHGLICMGQDLVAAFNKMDALENAALSMIYARAAGQPQVIPAQSMAAIRQSRK